jgi:hypothetical protein
VYQHGDVASFSLESGIPPANNACVVQAAEKFDEMLKPKNTRAKKQSVSKKQPVKV